MKPVSWPLWLCICDSDEDFEPFSLPEDIPLTFLISEANFADCNPRINAGCSHLQQFNRR